MVFSSIEFLFLFFPVTLFLYYAIPQKHLKWRNVLLLAVSLVYYGWGEPVYVFLMVATIAADYVFGRLIEVARSPKKKKTVLVISVVFNLGILGFFKYYDFFVTELRHIPGLSNLPLLGLGLPIGISFYTFQALSYVIDVYRHDADVQKNIVAFGTYVTFFPQLVAGPIVRYKDIDDMLTGRKETVGLFASGVRTFTAGLAKKVLLANTAGALWETLRGAPADTHTVLGAWFGIILYMFQIYFDFSGYSDMAIGLGKMFGFIFPENFNYPYIAESITDFWRRWHISLSTWFREYLYIPLGGNRCSKRRMYFNLLVVWLATGFWHGACRNYILWGLYYFVVLALEKAFVGKYIKKLPALLRHIYSLLLILFGWLLFVFEDMGAGVKWLGNMFGSGTAGFTSASVTYDVVRCIPLLIILVLACTPYPKRLFYRLFEKKAWFRIVSPVICAAGIIVSVAYLVNSTFNPFLYFRF